MRPSGKVGNATLHTLEHPVATHEDHQRTDSPVAELAPVRWSTAQHPATEVVDDRSQRVQEAVEIPPTSRNDLESERNRRGEHTQLEGQRKGRPDVSEVHD